MKKLKDILYKCNIINIKGNTNININKITFNSKESSNNTLFIAIKGNNVDGHKFINNAIKNGAIAIVCEELPKKLTNEITYVQVKNSRLALSFIAENFYNNPSDKLIITGVTGTNGKTTVASLLYKLFIKLNYKAGLISTINVVVNGKEKQAQLTTPDPITLSKTLNEMVKAGVKYCFMEVSSHAIAQHRISALKYKLAIFTNITHDHLDYHNTFKEYIYTKKMLFDSLDNESFALINKDDKNWKIIIQNCKAKIYTYGLKAGANYYAKILEKSINGQLLKINNKEIWTQLPGKFNAYNILAVLAAANLLIDNEEAILTALSDLKTVKGRFQVIRSPSGINAVIDYAHTPDALKNVLKSISEIKQNKGKIITVIGCGGNRDKRKRPLMAKIAVQFSNKVILTSDNPRYEDPEQILKDMEKGINIEDKKNVLKITNRKEAIKTAVALSNPGDIILVAGKGHENYQEIKGIKKHFDDKKVIEETFNIHC